MPDSGLDVSVVIPTLNEAENAASIAQAAAAALEKAEVSYEIIFIDNGSTDETVNVVKDLCRADDRIRLIVNNQNYGQMRSPTYGIYQASGAAVIGLCADFQDPPEMIGDFIARWRSGAEIVLGVRDSERTSATLKVTRAIGYGFFERFGDYRVIPNATGFGLYSRKVVDALKRWRDPEPFFRGMLVESGYALETIAYHRPERAGGVTKNNIFTLLSLALSGLASSSKKLLRAPLVLSVVAFGIGAIGLLGALALAMDGYDPWNVTFLGLGLVGLAIVLFFLGLIGEQVRIIALTVREAPLVLEKERVNFPPT